jgi:hypothetical protein
MADPTGIEGAFEDASSLAGAARDQGMEQLESAKGRLAEGAERVAAAVDRTADDLDGEGDDTISGFGHSVASLMRQLAGGLRERDVAQFASELGELARRNPGVFLAGSVALGFGVARFFKARAPQRAAGYEPGDAVERQQERERPRVDREEFDVEESLDLSANPAGIERRGEDDSRAFEASRQSTNSNSEQPATARDDEGAQAKPRGAGRKVKSQRPSAPGRSASSAAALRPDSPTKDAPDAGVPDDTGGKGS